jgi:hypothetical protein
MTLLSFDSAQEVSKISSYIDYIGAAHSDKFQKPSLYNYMPKKVSSVTHCFLHLLRWPALGPVYSKTGERVPHPGVRARALCSSKVPRTTDRATKRATLVARKNLSPLESQLQRIIFHFYSAKYS